MQRWLLLPIAGIALLGLTATRAVADVYAVTAARYGVDPLLLQAIAKVESSGHPWVLNVDGEPLRFDSSESLVAYFKHIEVRPWMVTTVRSGRRYYRWFSNEQEAKRYFLFARKEDHQLALPPNLQTELRRIRAENIDVGVMQINWRFHRERSGMTVEELVDPVNNVDYAARYLLDLIQKHGVWPGIARYHSGNPARQRVYQQRVWSAYQSLKIAYDRARQHPRPTIHAVNEKAS